MTQASKGTEAAANTAQKPEPIKPLEGTIKSDSLESLAAWVGQTALMNCAKNLVNELKIAPNSNVLIVGASLTLADDLGLIELRQRLKWFRRAFELQEQANQAAIELTRPKKLEIKDGAKAFTETAPKPQPFDFASLLTLTAAGLPQAATFLSFFRSDFEIKGNAITLTDRALQMAVLGAFLKSDIRTSTLHLSRIDQSSVLDDLETTFTSRLPLETSSTLLATRLAAVQLEIEGVKVQLAEAVAAGKDTKELKNQLAERQVFAQPISDSIDASKVLMADFEIYLKQINTPQTGQTYSPLSQAAIRAHAIEIGVKYVLSLGVGVGASETVTRRSVWPWSNSVSFVGAISCDYVLIDTTQNTVKAAGIVTQYASMLQNPDNPSLTLEAQGSISNDPQASRTAWMTAGVLVLVLLWAVKTLIPNLNKQESAWIFGVGITLALVAFGSGLFVIPKAKS
jgi:hypothetical protein